jgi:hypothetical protein
MGNQVKITIEHENGKRILRFDDGDAVADNEYVESLLFHLGILLPHCELKDTFYVSNDNIREQTLKEVGEWINDSLLFNIQSLTVNQAYIAVDKIVESLKQGKMTEED